MSKDTDRAWMLNAVITGCATVIWFRLPDPTEAEFAARHSFLSHLDYAEWKPGTERPVVVDHRRETIHNSSHSDMHGEHSMEGHSRSHASAYGSGSTTARATSSGTSQANADLSSYSMTPPLSLFGPNASTAAMLPTIIGQGTGTTNSESSFEQEMNSAAESEFASEMDGEAESSAHGTSSAQSFTEGSGETFVPVLEWLPSQLYSLPEQLARAAATIQSLAPREVIIKAGEAPVHARTTDLPPAFKSPAFKAAMLPVFARACAERSPYLLPIAEVDALIAARSARALPSPLPEPDFSTQPLPVVDEPLRFASEWWARKTSSDKARKPKPKKSPRGRRPVGDRLDDRHERFAVIEGGDNEPDSK